MAQRTLDRRSFLKSTALGAAGLAASVTGLSSGCARPAASARKRVLVLGIDGMDPVFLQTLARRGDMPNFRRLFETGSFRKFGTSTPPQSPVAWANFITGTNPGGHGIFDFIHRHPQSMTPYLSTSETESSEWPLKLGKYTFPLKGGDTKLLRRGTPFWSLLDDHDIPATLVKIPSNFPPTEFSGRSLSGLGTPDLLGTYGKYTYFCDVVPENVDEWTGGRAVEVNVSDNVVRTKLAGPQNSFLEDQPLADVDVTVHIDPVVRAAEIRIGDQRIVLKEGEWSDWRRVSFELVPHLASVSGICHVYLKEIAPHFKMYVSALHIDPVKPALPICTPEDYSKELVEKIGLFDTKGLPTDTKALMEGTLDDGEYLAQSQIILAKRLKMYEYELSRFDEGFLFFYFCNLDLDQHMLWRAHDKRHPAYTPEGEAYRGAVPELYRRMDDVVGRTFEAMDEQTALYIISDHGFAPFYKAFNLNSWLEREGFATLTTQDDRESYEFFDNLDWTRSRAYGLGMNGLYLNLDGREANGIISADERRAVEDELAERLLAERDPETGEQVISHVYKARETFKGPYTEPAPDLVIGYNRGYRAGWDTIIGKFPHAVLEPNDKAWSGDHCVDPPVVPGTFVTNRPGAAADPSLMDMAPTILEEFGIKPPDEMDGRPVSG